MDVKVKITMADPAGNRTAFVEGDVPADRYAAVGAALLKDPDLRAEQAGFLCPPTMGSHGRLQMMGGEFCGNAARSFGLLIGLREGLHPGDTIPIEISGSSSVLNVLLEENGAWISMPLPEEIIDIEVPGSNGPLHYPAVVLEGITHVILENVKPSEKLAHAVIEQAAAITHADAAGAIFVTNGSMTPAVWVKETNSFVWESSCGSGTLAATIWLGREVKNGSFYQELKQPGGTLKASFTITDGHYTETRLGGPVTLEEPIFKMI